MQLSAPREGGLPKQWPGKYWAHIGYHMAVQQVPWSTSEPLSVARNNDKLAQKRSSGNVSSTSQKKLPAVFCTSCPPHQTGHQHNHHEEGLWSHWRHSAYPRAATLEHLAQKINPPCKSCPVRGRMLMNLFTNHWWSRSATLHIQAGRKPRKQQQSWLEGSGQPWNYALCWGW